MCFQIHKSLAVSYRLITVDVRDRTFVEVECGRRIGQEPQRLSNGAGCLSLFGIVSFEFAP